MKPALAVAIATLLITLQGAVLSYAVSIERRLTRVETILERPTAPAAQQPHRET